MNVNTITAAVVAIAAAIVAVERVIAQFNALRDRKARK